MDRVHPYTMLILVITLAAASGLLPAWSGPTFECAQTDVTAPVGVTLCFVGDIPPQGSGRGTVELRILTAVVGRADLGHYRINYTCRKPLKGAYRLAVGESGGRGRIERRGTIEVFDGTSAPFAVSKIELDGKGHATLDVKGSVPKTLNLYLLSTAGNSYVLPCKSVEKAPNGTGDSAFRVDVYGLPPGVYSLWPVYSTANTLLIGNAGVLEIRDALKILGPLSNASFTGSGAKLITRVVVDGSIATGPKVDLYKVVVDGSIATGTKVDLYVDHKVAVSGTKSNGELSMDVDVATLLSGQHSIQAIGNGDGNVFRSAAITIDVQNPALDEKVWGEANAKSLDQLKSAAEAALKATRNQSVPTDSNRLRVLDKSIARTSSGGYLVVLRVDMLSGGETGAFYRPGSNDYSVKVLPVSVSRRRYHMALDSGKDGRNAANWRFLRVESVPDGNFIGPFPSWTTR